MNSYRPQMVTFIGNPSISILRRYATLSSVKSLDAIREYNLKRFATTTHCREILVNWCINSFAPATNDTNYFLRMLLEPQHHGGCFPLLNNHPKGKMFLRWMKDCFKNYNSWANVRLGAKGLVIELLGPRRVSMGDLSMFTLIVRTKPLLQLVLDALEPIEKYDSTKIKQLVMEKLVSTAIVFQASLGEIASNAMRKNPESHSILESLWFYHLGGYQFLLTAMYLFYRTAGKLTRSFANGMYSMVENYVTNTEEIDDFLSAFPILSEASNLEINDMFPYQSTLYRCITRYRRNKSQGLT